MEFVIWVETRISDRTFDKQMVAKIERPASLAVMEEVGLTLQDGKAVIREIQTRIVEMQFKVASKLRQHCLSCQSRQTIKDWRTRSLRTVFGEIRVSCCRYRRCGCRGGAGDILWPLSFMRHRRTTPELEYLLASWGCRMPYRRAAELLGELLPIQQSPVAQSSVRRHTLAVGGRLDERVTVPDEYDFPESQRRPDPIRNRLTVSIDGTYIRSDRISGLAQHYVVAGRIESDGKISGTFAWVGQKPSDARLHIRAALEANGWTPASRVDVLADGADGLASLVETATETKPCSVLDWFHISMRIRAIEQMCTKTALVVEPLDSEVSAIIREKLPRLRYQMWHGRWAAAIHRMRDAFIATGIVAATLVSAQAVIKERLERFRRHLLDLRDYLVSNQEALTNYSHAHRHGLRISSAPAESGMNHLVNQRMGKHQPMRWSAEGAHKLLQVRCALFDRRLETLFREQYPMFRRTAPAIPLPIW
jgi:hypothetical protein